MRATDEQIVRVTLMSQGDPAWDLSPKDTKALAAVIAELTELREKLAAIEAKLKSLRRYVAYEGRDEEGLPIIGFAYDASINGFTHNPKYDCVELLEAMEKWLHHKIDSILHPQPEQTNG